MKNLFLFLTLLVLSVNTTAQESQKAQDTTKVQKLDEVLVKAVRVEVTSPITHSNVTKKQTALKHEIAHALYATDEIYKTECQRILYKMSDKLKNKLGAELLKHAYAPEFIIDEVHAYMADYDKSMFCTIMNNKHFKTEYNKIRRQIGKLYKETVRREINA